jgi:hypothetical protein
MTRTQRNAISETAALRARGANLFMLKGATDTEGLAKLKQLLWKSDVHIILSWLLPAELNALVPILKERRNYSILTDDWYTHPYWFLRHAEYVLFRKYNGIAVRLGQAAFVPGAQPPLLLDPRPQVSKFSIVASILRPALVGISPFADLWNRWRRRGDEISAKKLLYFPFAIEPSNVPLSTKEPQYDFANTGGACGIFLMRDPYAPFRYSFANLYEDRRRLVDSIAHFENNPFTFFDCRREKGLIPYDQYILKNQQSRFLVATGGLHEATVPKYMEYACVGTPMIGRALPYEYPWLSECLFPVDIMNLDAQRLKPLLHEALERYPVLRENCLNLRDRLLDLYSIHRLLDMVQAQADGTPIPEVYLRREPANFGLPGVERTGSIR